MEDESECMNQIFTLEQFWEKKCTRRSREYERFMELRRACERVNWEALRQVLRMCSKLLNSIRSIYVNGIKNTYVNSLACVRIRW